MKFASVFSAAALVASVFSQPVQLDKKQLNATEEYESDVTNSSTSLKTLFGKPFAIFQPKVFIINMFLSEAEAWLDSLEFSQTIDLPGLSPVYPTVSCVSNYSICQVTTGEGEINAAASITALGLSPLFDLSHTYFLISGIAGGEPNYTTMGSVTYARYTVQVALEYQVSYQEFIGAHPNWTSGYWAYGTDDPWTYPQNVYGTEVFEVNTKLRDRAVELAETAKLDNGTDENIANRELYTQEAASSAPAIVKCDGLTSDNYFTGNVLGDYFSFYTKMMTNGSGIYCATAQEDNASLEAFTRLDKYGITDFNRVVVQRSISDFSRPPPSKANDTVAWFNEPNDGGSTVAFNNLPIAGLPFVWDILENWEDVYFSGEKFKPSNYTGDILATLGGTPDFGKASFGIA